jgi:uncharacterized protein YecT (DUF1311 family)
VLLLLFPPTDAKIIQQMRTILVLRWVALFTFLILAAGSFAQSTDRTNQTVQDCQQAASESAMRICENGRYDAAQRELNSAYQSLLQHLDIGQKEKLRLSQRAWLRFRTANADLQASLVQGGTLAPLIKVATLTEMTNARVSELKKALNP